MSSDSYLCHRAEDREDTVIVPAVVVYLTSLSPQLNMTALRYVLISPIAPTL